MEIYVVTGGEVLSMSSDVRWVSTLLSDTTAGRTLHGVPPASSVRLVVENDRRPFRVSRADVVTRGAWRVSDGVVIEDACGSGFSLLIEPHDDHLSVRARYRPPAQTRLASLVLRSRFVLLTRAVLTQYPVLWWAGVTSGRAPLHISTVTTHHGVVALAGPSGVGKSTLVRAELDGGGNATSDNLALSDGRHVFGVVEPLKTMHGRGRRTSHGRREEPLTGAVEALEPSRVIAVQLGDGPATCVAASPDVVWRALVTGTYMAGELRRYWTFAATLAAATGLGPPHPPVEETARRLVSSTATHGIRLSRRQESHLRDLLDDCLGRQATAASHPDPALETAAAPPR